jgi:methylglyoxal synthase
MKVKIYYAEIAPELESTEFDLNSVKIKGECSIGRSPECGLVLEGPDLSRQHAKFLSRDGNYYFSDLGSRNGSLFNGELAEPNREYLLNSGDKIRIGDFILNIEQEEELAATVFKVIDPSFFKAKQPQAEDILEPEEIVSQTLPIEELTERVILIVDNSIATDTPDPVVEAQQPTFLVEDELEEIAKDIPDSVEVPHPLVLVNNEFDEEEDIPDPVIAEQPPSALVEDEWDEDNTPNPVSAEQPPSALVDDGNEENLVDRVPAEHPPLDLVDDGDEEDTPDPIIAEQPLSALVNDELDDENILDRVSQEYPLPTLADDDEWVEEDLSENLVLEEQSASVLFVDEFDEEVTPDRAIEDQPALPLIVDEVDDADIPSQVPEEHSVSALIENELDEEDTPSAIEDQLAPALVEDEWEEDILSRVPEEQPASALVEDEFEEEVTPDLSIAEQPASALVVDKLDAADTLEHRTATDAEDELSAAALNKDIPLETPSTISTAVAVAGVVSGFNANNNGLGAELLNKKQIVLIAHDTKVADLTDIVDRHKDFLAKCLTISWTSIADSLRQETGMVVSKEIPSGAAGGFQNIAGLVNSGDVLAVIFLKDFFAQSQTGQANEEALLRLCNINEILLATNIATADAIVYYLQS